MPTACDIVFTTSTRSYPPVLYAVVYRSSSRATRGNTLLQGFPPKNRISIIITCKPWYSPLIALSSLFAACTLITGNPSSSEIENGLHNFLVFLLFLTLYELYKHIVSPTHDKSGLTLYMATHSLV